MNLLGGMTFCPLCESAYDFPRSRQNIGWFREADRSPPIASNRKSITRARIMAFYRTAIAASTLVAALSFMLATALAHDETKYPATPFHGDAHNSTGGQKTLRVRH